MNTFIIERRANADSAWTATNHIIEADTANGALRAFGLRDAFSSDRVKIATGGKSGRQYRATLEGNSETVAAPLAALRRNVSGKVAAGKAESITAIEAPYGLKADGTPKAKPGRKPGSEMTVTSAHSDKPSDKPVYTREMRLANLAKGRAKRAENIAARKGAPKPASKRPSANERKAAALLAQLDALQSEVAKLGIKL